MLQSIVHSEKTRFEVSKQSVQHFMQNSILEQAKMNGNYTKKLVLETVHLVLTLVIIYIYIFIGDYLCKTIIYKSIFTTGTSY